MSFIRSLLVVSLAFLFTSGALAKADDIAGDWQGILKGASPGSELRLVLHVKKSNSSGWEATLYSIDQLPEGLDGTAVSSLSVQGSDFKFSIDSLHAGYEGKLAADGNSIKGAWTGRRAQPLAFERSTAATAWKYELPRHDASFVEVAENVRLEVLDYGGTGRSIVCLAGLGATAHVFDKVAPKLTPKYHVYAITRRGFGKSSTPAPTVENYSADRLGDDVLAVISSLKLDRPVLVGHSLAGEELSSMGSRHPERVAGLIYLDAAYPYAYYDRARGNFLLDAIELREKLERLMVGGGQQAPLELSEELLKIDLPQIEKDLREEQKEMQVNSGPPGQQQQPEAPAIVKAIFEGERKYTDIRVPVLAVFAVPHDRGSSFKDDPAAGVRWEAWDTERMETMAQAFQTGLPAARVVRLAHANHWVLATHENEVLREMLAFINSLR